MGWYERWDTYINRKEKGREERTSRTPPSTSILTWRCDIIWMAGKTYAYIDCNHWHIPWSIKINWRDFFEFKHSSVRFVFNWMILNEKFSRVFHWLTSLFFSQTDAARSRRIRYWKESLLLKETDQSIAQWEKFGKQKKYEHFFPWESTLSLTIVVICLIEMRRWWTFLSR